MALKVPKIGCFGYKRVEKCLKRRGCVVSWSDANHIYNGYLYVSKSFFLYKTTNIMLHKNAIPKDIAKKLGV